MLAGSNAPGASVRAGGLPPLTRANGARPYWHLTNGRYVADVDGAARGSICLSLRRCASNPVLDRRLPQSFPMSGRFPRGYPWQRGPVPCRHLEWRDVTVVVGEWPAHEDGVAHAHAPSSKSGPSPARHPRAFRWFAETRSQLVLPALASHTPSSPK